MGSAAVTEVKFLLSHLQGKGLGTSIIGGESCLCHIPLLHQNHVPKCPLPNLSGDFEALLCIGSGQTATHKTKFLFCCSFLSRISRKSSLLSFPIISKHSPVIKSELPGVRDPEGHSIKSDHSQTGAGGGGGRPLPTKGSRSLMDTTAPAKVLLSGLGASRPCLPHVLAGSLQQLTHAKSLLCQGLSGALTRSAQRGLGRSVGVLFPRPGEVRELAHSSEVVEQTPRQTCLSPKPILPITWLPCWCFPWVPRLPLSDQLGRGGAPAS